MSIGVVGKLGIGSQRFFTQYPHLLGSKHLNSEQDVHYVRVLSRFEEKEGPLVMIPEQPEIELILASLRAELLHDLLISMLSAGKQKPEAILAEEIPISTRIKWMLTLAGVFLAICEIVDTLATVLSILTYPSAILLMTGLACAIGSVILSIVFFYGFNLAKISSNLGVSVVNVPKLLDAYFTQLQEIKKLAKTIQEYSLARLSVEDLDELEYIISLLETRLQGLAEVGKQFDIALHTSEMQTVKTLVSSVVGLLFFGNGFFTGQSLGLFFARFFMPAVAPTFLPLALFSILVGLAAFSLYWYVEQERLEKLVSSWFGLDEDKIDQLCNPQTLDEEDKFLSRLKDQVCSTRTQKNLCFFTTPEPSLNTQGSFNEGYSDFSLSG